MTTTLRVIFAGSPEAAVPSLDALIAGPHHVVAVVTREDSPQGRRRVLTSTPVAAAADAAGIPIVKANRLGAVTDELIAYGADLGVVVAYGGLIREPLLSAPRLGWINLHFSVLPKWRGAAPVQHAIIAGDAISGASVFQLVPELDAGPVFATETTPIGAHTTAGQLLDVLSVSGARLLGTVVDGLADGTARSEEQAGEVTLAPKLTLADGLLDWSAAAAAIAARQRGVTPEPGASTLLDGERFKILGAAVAHGITGLRPGSVDARDGRIVVGTGDEALELLEVQPAGKRPMAASDWWRGRRRDTETTFDLTAADPTTADLTTAE